MSTLSSEELDHRADLIRRILAKHVRQNPDCPTITYGKLARHLKLPTQGHALVGSISPLLGRVCERYRRPYFTALVVRANTGTPGQGFFTMIESLEERRIRNQQTFWEKQRDEAIKRCKRIRLARVSPATKRRTR